MVVKVGPIRNGGVSGAGQATCPHSTARVQKPGRQLMFGVSVARRQHDDVTYNVQTC